MTFALFNPPHRYTPTFVLDVSVAASWAISRHYSPYTNRVQFKLISAAALVAFSWPVDLAECLRLALQQGETVQHRVDSLKSSLSFLNIYVDAEGALRALNGAFTLAQTHNIPVHDAAHLELALRMSLPLATINPALTQAAAVAGVPIFTP